MHITIKDSNSIKGIGLLLLLAHHLFYVQNALFNDIHLFGNYYLVNKIGIWSKVCVAVFVFISGYGLTAKALNYKGTKSIYKFYWHRFSKLFLNYWFIWICFVPISVFLFGRTFQDVYLTNVILKSLLDFFGILNLFGLYGYNATWWFYSCIIVLYLSFPFLYKILEKKGSLFIIISISVLVYFLPLFYPTIIARSYLSSFAVGMLCCKYVEKDEFMNSKLWIAIFIILAIERFITPEVVLFDSILVLSIFGTYFSIKIPKLCKDILSFIGKHSMNIFLFHTFIYHYWFEDFIYSSRNPIVIYFLLLSICLFVSVILEYIKKVFRFNSIVERIDKLMK